jgi:hypothetical protein
MSGIQGNNPFSPKSENISENIHSENKKKLSLIPSNKNIEKATTPVFSKTQYLEKSNAELNTHEEMVEGGDDDDDIDSFLLETEQSDFVSNFAKDMESDNIEQLSEQASISDELFEFKIESEKIIQNEQIKKYVNKMVVKGIDKKDAEKVVNEIRQFLICEQRGDTLFVRNVNFTKEKDFKKLENDQLAKIDGNNIYKPKNTFNSNQENKVVNVVHLDQNNNIIGVKRYILRTMDNDQYEQVKKAIYFCIKFNNLTRQDKIKLENKKSINIDVSQKKNPVRYRLFPINSHKIQKLPGKLRSELKHLLEWMNNIENILSNAAKKEENEKLEEHNHFIKEKILKDNIAKEYFE